MMLQRYIDGETLAAIGEDFNLTRERVRQIVSKLGGSRAEESRSRRAESCRLAARALRHDFIVQYGELAGRLAYDGATRDEAIRRIHHLYPGLDLELAENALRESGLVFDKNGDDLFSPAAIEAGIWYLLGSELGLSPNPQYAAEVISLELMDELSTTLLAGNATEKDVATVLGVIGATRKHVVDHPAATITGARYNELREELLDALGWVSAKGLSPWPPTRQTLMRRYKYWNAALETLGLATAGRGRTPGLVKFTETDYQDAIDEFVALQRTSQSASTYAAYEELARRRSDSEFPLPSGSSMRNYFGGWSDAIRAANAQYEVA